MTIEEATVIFGKGHDQWSDRERREFVRALEVEFEVCDGCGQPGCEGCAGDGRG